MPHPLPMKPTGWFQVGWSTDFGPDSVKPLRYFDTDLVAYRGKDGVVRIHDAYCEHLGAHLGYGGCVTDAGLQCPFHGWVWAPDGSNASIPYQDRPNKARRVRPWIQRQTRRRTLRRRLRSSRRSDGFIHPPDS